MTDKTEISWCDSTWNPWIGCAKVGPGCDNCYAETLMDTRYGRVKWGAGNPRVRTSAANWRKPVQWNKAQFYECAACGWRGDLPRSSSRIDAVCPLCRKEVSHARRRVFCASLADVFDNEAPQEWRDDLFELIRHTPNLDWLLLTKRIGNVKRPMVPPYWANDGFPPNVWLGATVVNQEEYDRDIPKLLAVPARVRFLSCEPLLGPIKLDLRKCCGRPLEGHPDDGYFQPPDPPRCCEDYEAGIDWVIAGGESGPKARPMHPSWAQALRDQCVVAGVPAGVAFHFKQWGEWQIASAANGHHDSVMPETGEKRTWVSEDGKTHNPSAPSGRDVWAMARVGKNTAGRLLDGRTWDEFPSGIVA